MFCFSSRTDALSALRVRFPHSREPAPSWVESGIVDEGFEARSDSASAIMIAVIVGVVGASIATLGSHKNPRVAARRFATRARLHSQRSLAGREAFARGT